MKGKIYICQQCGVAAKKWVGKCPECSAWGSIVEEFVESKKAKSLTKVFDKDLNLESLESITTTFSRIDTKIEEINGVLGGGIVKGSAVLIAGEPGIGKSTLILQLSNKIASDNLSVIYATGEESLEQIKLRSSRLNIRNKNIVVTNHVSLDLLLALILKNKPDFLIIDSVQTLYFDKIDSPSGSVSQIRTCVHELIQTAKLVGTTLILIGHITKEGQIAGPKILEHVVDVVLSFEGDHSKQLRIIRSTKNRHGSTNEVAFFQMVEGGLKEISNPSSLFLPEDCLGMEKQGSCIFVGIEGTKAVLLEIQALVVPSFLASPRRATVGWDHNRLAMLLAVLNAKLGVNALNKEVYLNVVGGLKINEPAGDLAAAIALFTAAYNMSFPNNTVAFGEIGLSGEVRQVINTDARIKEAEKLGFKQAIVPKSVDYSCNMKLVKVSHLEEVKKFLFNMNNKKSSAEK